jgi:nitrous oxidase accessory protein NosD
MVGNPTRIALACALVAGPVVCGTGAAQAQPHPNPGHATLVVSPGSGTPIQNAVNRAHAGDTIKVRPGRYAENVVVTKSLTLMGSGWGKNGTVLTQPKKPRKTTCEDSNGICVTGRLDKKGNVVRAVAHVKVTGFEVRGFSGSGVVGFGTDDFRAWHIKAVGNKEYGVTSFHGTNSRLTDNDATGSGEAGIYLGDSPKARGWVGHNNAWNNAIGVLVRDSTGVTVAGNRADGNCAGILSVNTGEGAIAGGDMTLRDNRANGNSRHCAAEEDVPPLSGIGIGLAGVHNVKVTHNTADGNRKTGASIASGGIAVFSTKSIGGADARDNRVVGNEALGNRPYDLFWDRKGKNNVFKNNKHSTSSPANLG